jgi:hypothetical protein
MLELTVRRGGATTTKDITDPRKRLEQAREMLELAKKLPLTPGMREECTDVAGELSRLELELAQPRVGTDEAKSEHAEVIYAQALDIYLRAKVP